MSEQTKKDMNHVKEHIKKQVEQADTFIHFTKERDGELTRKIQKFKESGNDVVKHIEERMGK